MNILVQCDNSTAVGYVNHVHLCVLNWEMFMWTINHTISLRAVHIIGSNNDLVDALSHSKVHLTQWTLHSNVAQLFKKVEHAHVNLFTLANNAQLLMYCTRISQPLA